MCMLEHNQEASRPASAMRRLTGITSLRKRQEGQTDTAESDIENQHFVIEDEEEPAAKGYRSIAWKKILALCSCRCWRRLMVAIILLLPVFLILLDFVLWARQSGFFDPVYIKPVTEDYLSNIGKSCTYLRWRRRWECRECDSGKCKRLKPRGSCKPFVRKDWDAFPRARSYYDPASNVETGMRTLNFLRKFHYEGQPLCSVFDCWDLARCNRQNFTVFVNTTQPHAMIDYTERNWRLPGTNFRRVDDYRDACLSVIDPSTYSSWSSLSTAEHWQNTGGQNNLFYNLSRTNYPDNPLQRNQNSDFPFPFFHVQKAAVASETLSSAQLRAGYDMVLPLRRRWGRPVRADDVDIHRPRQYLLSFRGAIHENVYPYHQQRWLALEYWEDAADVVVDCLCTKRHPWTGKHTLLKPYDLPSSAYDDLMWNTTFGFAPGGSGVGSFRFGEILSTGTIPVVTPDYVPPFAPEVDWSSCVVRVSEARIVDLPRALRKITPAEIKDRQKQCWRLLHIVFGDRQEEDKMWHDDQRATFAKAMEIWALRIQHALDIKDRVNFENFNH